MYRVHCLLPRSDAERLSDVLSGMDPSPASAVSVEEASKISWSLDAFCIADDQANEAAAIIEREAPMHHSNVMLLDPKTGAPTRVRHKLDADGTKERVAAKSGDALPGSR